MDCPNDCDKGAEKDPLETPASLVKPLILLVIVFSFLAGMIIDRTIVTHQVTVGCK
jgi:hypothetical protein